MRDEGQLLAAEMSFLARPLPCRRDTPLELHFIPSFNDQPSILLHQASDEIAFDENSFLNNRHLYIDYSSRRIASMLALESQNDLFAHLPFLALIRI